MQRYFAAAAIILLIVLVLLRIFMMRIKGIKAMRFGEIDKKDFLIPPFVLFFLYLIVAGTFSLPEPGGIPFHNDILSWAGVALCMLGLILFLLSLISFGKSFRLGIDNKTPGQLVTTGVFSICRNPIYTSFGLILLGINLIYFNWILILYLFAGFWLFNRQVLREEVFLKKIYGDEYFEYCKKVRRYL